MTQNLHDAFLVELFNAAVELLIATRIEHADRREKLGGEAWDTRIVDPWSGEEGVADAHIECVHESNDITRIGLLDGLALLTKDRVGVLGRKWFAGGAVGDHHAAFELARAHPSEGNSVTVRAIHVGLHLEHKRTEVVIEVPYLAGV